MIPFSHPGRSQQCQSPREEISLVDLTRAEVARKLTDLNSSQRQPVDLSGSGLDRTTWNQIEAITKQQLQFCLDHPLRGNDVGVLSEIVRRVLLQNSEKLGPDAESWRLLPFTEAYRRNGCVDPSSNSRFLTLGHVEDAARNGQSYIAAAWIIVKIEKGREVAMRRFFLKFSAVAEIDQVESIENTPQYAPLIAAIMKRPAMFWQHRPAAGTAAAEWLAEMHGEFKAARNGGSPVWTPFTLTGAIDDPILPRPALGFYSTAIARAAAQAQISSLLLPWSSRNPLAIRGAYLTPEEFSDNGDFTFEYRNTGMYQDGPHFITMKVRVSCDNVRVHDEKPVAPEVTGGEGLIDLRVPRYPVHCNPPRRAESLTNAGH